MKRASLFAVIFVLASGRAAAEPPPANAEPPVSGTTLRYNPPAQTTVNGVDINARFKDPLACAPKEYPIAARRNAEEGSTILYFLIDVDGKVLESRIGQSSGWPDLDDTALAAFSAPNCEFYPIIALGKAVKSWARLKYTWRLTEPAAK